MTDTTIMAVAAIVALGVFGFTTAGAFWAVRSRESIFAALFICLALVAGVAAATVMIEIDAAQRCAERTRAGLMKHTTFMALEERRR